MRKALQAEQGKADMERKVCQRVLVLHNFLTLQCSLKLQWKCSGQFWLHMKYINATSKTSWCSQMTFWLVVHVNLMLSLFYFLKQRMQVPISRNTLKYLNLDKLKHYITCKSYTKVNSKVRFTWSTHQTATFKNIMVFFKWPITFNEPLNKQITK